MARSGPATPKSESLRLEKWRHVGGGIDKSGASVTMPLSLKHAQIVDGLAQRYGVVPSRILDEPSALVMHTTQIVYEEKPKG